MKSMAKFAAAEATEEAGNAMLERLAVAKKDDPKFAFLALDSPFHAHFNEMLIAARRQVAEERSTMLSRTAL